MSFSRLSRASTLKLIILFFFFMIWREYGRKPQKYYFLKERESERMMEYFARTQKNSTRYNATWHYGIFIIFITQPFLMSIFHLLTILQPFSSYNIIFKKKSHPLIQFWHNPFHLHIHEMNPWIIKMIKWWTKLASLDLDSTTTTAWDDFLYYNAPVQRLKCHVTGKRGCYLLYTRSLVHATQVYCIQQNKNKSSCI